MNQSQLQPAKGLTGPEPKVLVLGAGAIGLLYAGLLASIHRSRVTLITRRIDARDSIRHLLTIKKLDGSTIQIAGLDTRRPEECSADLDGTYDAAIIAVAGYDTTTVAPLVGRLLRSSGIAITVQNGLDNQTQLAAVLGTDRALQGSTSFGTYLSNSNEVSFGSNGGGTWLPYLPDNFAWLNAWLSSAGLNPISIADPVELGWRKAAIAVCGWLAVIFELPLGKVFKHPSSWEVSDQACLEVIDIANACGIDIDRMTVLATLREVRGQFTEDSKSSLFTAYTAGRRTEIESRLGTLLQRANSMNVSAPTLRTLYLLTKLRLEMQGRHE